MNSEIALNMIGQTLMAGRDNTQLGEDEDWDFRAYHKSMQYFHLAWLSEKIDKICQKHDKKAKFNVNDYMQALRTLVTYDKKMFEIWHPTSRRAYRELIIHTTPEIHIKVNGRRRKPHVQITDDAWIVIYNNIHSNLYPSEIIELFSDIDTKLKERTKDILISGLKDLVPESLKKLFLRGKITQDRGNSCHYDASYSIGHEIRLKVTDTHDMAYAYIPDYFWDERARIRTFINVKYGYWTLTEISTRLPKDVEFICQHRDDCGVILTKEDSTISTDEFLRRKAVLMVYKDQELNSCLNDEYYESIMAYCHLTERFSLKDFISMCESDIFSLKNQKYEILSRIGTYANQVTITFLPESVAVFLMENREHQWTRECYLRFPYHAHLSFLKDIGFYLEKSKELVNVFDKSWDIETTIGLLNSHPDVK